MLVRYNMFYLVGAWLGNSCFLSIRALRQKKIMELFEASKELGSPLPPMAKPSLAWLAFVFFGEGGGRMEQVSLLACLVELDLSNITAD